jgi:hypothetical protein
MDPVKPDAVRSDAPRRTIDGQAALRLADSGAAWASELARCRDAVISTLALPGWRTQLYRESKKKKQTFDDCAPSLSSSRSHILSIIQW